MKKDEAIAKIGSLEKQVEDWKAQDRKVREELSGSLGAGTYRKNSYSDPEQIVYSWNGIFRELGKLIAKRDHVDLRDDVKDLQKEFQFLSSAVDRLGHPQDTKPTPRGF